MIEGRMVAQDYEYDVFFSYKRHRLTLRWTREVHTRLHYPPVSIDIPEITEQRMERMRARAPFVETPADIEREAWPAVSALLRTESIVSLAHVPFAPRSNR
jgi:hypothetical protein